MPPTLAYINPSDELPHHVTGPQYFNVEKKIGYRMNEFFLRSIRGEFRLVTSAQRCEPEAGISSAIHRRCVGGREEKRLRHMHQFSLHRSQRQVYSEEVVSDHYYHHGA